MEEEGEQAGGGGEGGGGGGDGGPVPADALSAPITPPVRRNLIVGAMEEEGEHAGGGGEGRGGGGDGGPVPADACSSPIRPPVRRNLWDTPPPEGPDDGMFTVEIHHAGFFCGVGTNRSYLDGKSDHFDYCQRENFCDNFIDYFLKELCYDLSDPKIVVYWHKQSTEHGGHLIHVNCEEIAREIAAASLDWKPILMYVDHVDFLAEQCRQGREDVAQAAACLPKVLSPRKGGYLKREDRQAKTEEEGIVEGENKSESEEDSDFNDSDYDFDDDDKLFAENVDTKVVDDLVMQHKPLQCYPRGEDDVGEEETLQAIGGPKLNFSVHNPSTDRDNPVFKLGMIFPTVQDLRRALSMYCVSNRIQITKKRNNSKRLEAVCTTDCPWHLIASKDSRAEAFLVTTYVGEHTCEKVWKVKELTGKLLTEKFIDEFRLDEKMSLKSFGNKVQQKWNMEPDRFKLARARLEALKQIHGDEVAQWACLWDYGQEIRTANPGSSYYLKCIGNSFSTLYYSLDACKRGWLRGCRPILCLDGTHIKTKFGGQLLTAVGIDPNDCIYPIAMAIVEVECYSSWLWFLNTLKTDLNIVNTSPFTIMSDKQKGLIKAVLELFPDSEHRFCVRHMHQNMNQLHKGEVVKNHVWACARSTNVSRWNENMEKFKEECPDAHAWLEEMPPNTWCRAFFSEFPKCDILLNNTCEVFNKWIVEARELPVLSMMERIQCQLMSRYYENEKEAREKWVGQICPKIKKKLDKNAEYAAESFPKGAGMGVYKVGTGYNKNVYIVEVNFRACSCRRWQLTGIPCAHALACFRTERIQPELMVSSCYSIQTYMQAYGTHIRPVRDRSEWTKLNGPEIKPPFYEKVVGRPRKNRRKAPEEKKDVTKLSKHGVQIHCGYCRGADHNRTTCEKLKADTLASNEGNVDDVVQEQQPETSKTARKRRRTVQEKVSVPNPTRRPTTIDEYGDADVPEIREQIVHVHMDPSRDPSNMKDSMVSILAHEKPTIIIGEQEPMPTESSFVAQHRDAIPIRTRVTTASTSVATTHRGRRRGRKPTGTGRPAPVVSTTRGGATTSNKGKGTVHTAAAIVGAVPTGRRSARGANIPAKGRGRAKWILFGDGQSSSSHQANQDAEATVLQTTQEPPAL